MLVEWNPKRILDWGFREFGNYKLFETNEEIASAGVWLGEASHVPLLAKQGILMTLERKYRKSLKVKIRHEAPVPAPIEKGARLGTIIVEVADRRPIKIPLIAGKSVDRLGPSGRLSAAPAISCGELRNSRRESRKIHHLRRGRRGRKVHSGQAARRFPWLSRIFRRRDP